MSATEKAVSQMREYARYISENAENIVGDIDAPNWVSEGGINVSFTLYGSGAIAPTVLVTHEYLVPDVLQFRFGDDKEADE